MPPSGPKSPGRVMSRAGHLQPRGSWPPLEVEREHFTCGGMRGVCLAQEIRNMHEEREETKERGDSTGMTPAPYPGPCVKHRRIHCTNDVLMVRRGRQERTGRSCSWPSVRQRDRAGSRCARVQERQQEKYQMQRAGYTPTAPDTPLRCHLLLHIPTHPQSATPLFCSLSRIPPTPTPTEVNRIQK